MGDPTPRPAVIHLNPARVESNASLSLSTPAVIPLHPARLRFEPVLTLSGQKVASGPLHGSVAVTGVFEGEAVRRSGRKLVLRALRPTRDDLAVTADGAGLGTLIGLGLHQPFRWGAIGAVVGLLGSYVDRIWRYAQVTSVEVV